MSSSRSILDGVFGRRERDREPVSAKPSQYPPEPQLPQESASTAADGYQPGDRIGEFEVRRVLGRGGFGVVYLVRLPVPGPMVAHMTYRGEGTSRPGQTAGYYIVYALKALRGELLADARVRQRFRQEALTQVELERHPHLLQADFVDEIAGRLYLSTEYIAPGAEGLNSLEGYLLHRPPDLAQSLRWAVQCCFGMEYAYGKGLRCHRDLKPANILITADHAVKIADFGLAGALDQVQLADGIRVHAEDDRIGLSAQTVDGAGFGTPTHMPPEQFTSAASCDERSDIYAFGVVLFQMASRGRLPFLAAPPHDRSPAEQQRFWVEMHRLHTAAPVPQVETPLYPVIERCLAKQPDRRLQSFAELRVALQQLLRRETGVAIEAPAAGPLTGGEWHRKGYCLTALGHLAEAIACYDRALAIEPRSATSWYSKGNCLAHLGRREEAIACHDQALALNPRDGTAWNNKGTVLSDLGRYQEACACFDRALALDPQDADVCSNKGAALQGLGCPEEALACVDRAVALDPLNPMRWANRVICFERLGRPQEAITCCDRALDIDPRLAMAWNVKGKNLAALGRRSEALECFDQALARAPELLTAWINRARFSLPWGAARKPLPAMSEH